MLGYSCGKELFQGVYRGVVARLPGGRGQSKKEAPEGAYKVLVLGYVLRAQAVLQAFACDAGKVSIAFDVEPVRVADLGELR